MEKKNNKLILMGMLTMGLSLLLMNLGRFEGVIPDSIIRVIGVATMIGAAVSIFFTVRALAEHTKESKASDKDKEQE